MNILKHKSLLTMAVSSLLSLPLLAATDGSLGTSSSGSVELRVEYTQTAAPLANIQVTGLEDFDFGTIEGPNNAAPPITLSDICVYMSVSGTYSITVDAVDMVGLIDVGTTDLLEVPVTYNYMYLDEFGNQLLSSSGNTDFQFGFIPSETQGCINDFNASLTVTPGAPSVLTDPNDSNGNPISTSDLFVGSLTITVAPE